MRTDRRIRNFLDGSRYAVVGASDNRQKYGNKVLRAYLQASLVAIPVHPTATRVEGLEAFPDLSTIPKPIHGISIITPPNITEHIVEEAAACGIKHLWVQPGAENKTVIEQADQHGMNLIAGGPCILVTLQYRDG